MKAEMHLASAQSQDTAAAVTGVVGLALLLLACLREVEILLCLGGALVVIGLVLVFLSRQNVVNARRDLADYLGDIHPDRVLQRRRLQQELARD